ncbi:MAG TPA: hypothetical protein VGM90_05655 [Kofleriaceae bacterium]|jgi:hypothetical protein
MTDRILQQVGDALSASRKDPALAKTTLEALWTSVGDDPLHRCAIASGMAGLAANAQEELMWDLRALDAGKLLDDLRLSAAGMGATSFELLASLHGNLADVYRRLASKHEHGPGCGHDH